LNKDEAGSMVCIAQLALSCLAVINISMFLF
jgi:hypothetical protein